MWTDCYRRAQVRLYAARPLRAGDAVTITYGDHGAAHFAQYYGRAYIIITRWHLDILHHIICRRIDAWPVAAARVAVSMHT